MYPPGGAGPEGAGGGVEAPTLRLLHLHSGNMYGGVEKVIGTLARYEAGTGMRSEFGICFEGRLSSELRDIGARVWMLGRVRLSRPWTVLRARRALQQLLAAERFNGVVCHSVWPQVIFGRVAQRAGLPQLLWLHDVLDGKHWLQRAAVRTRPDRLICNSRFTGTAAASVFTGIEADVVHCPVPPPESGKETGRGWTRAQFGTADSDTLILQVSRLQPLKGQLEHIQALARLKARSGWTAWMVGTPQRPEEDTFFDRLKEAARGHGIEDRIRFIDQGVDVAEVMAAADIYCQPNIGPEGFGLTFVEAMQARLPVITSSLGGALEIVDPSCGVLVTPGDVAGLASVLEMLVSDPQLRTRLGEAGARRAAILCDPVARVADLEKVVRKSFR